MFHHDRLLRFHRDGYLGPLPLAASILTPAARRALAEIASAGTHARHLDSRLVFELCTDPAVVEAVNAILGTDLLLWNSSFWIGECPWHQDLHDWPTLTVTAWIALTDTFEGCLEVLPGSHRGLLPPSPAAVPDSEAGRPISLPTGHFAVLSDQILHRCKPSTADRWALAARFTAPSVHVPGHRCILVSGSDHFGINKIGPPPARHTRIPVMW